MPSDAEIFKNAFKSKKENEPETKIIYKMKETFKNPYTDEEMKYIKRGLKAYLSTFTHNLERKKGNLKDSDNYDDLLAAMKLYKKIVGHYYYNEKLYIILGIEKGEDLEK